MKTGVEEVASSFSKKVKVNEIEAKDPSPALLAKPQLRSTSLHSIGAILKERTEQGSTSEDVVAMVADLAPRNSWNVTSSLVSQVEGSKSGPATLHLFVGREHL